MSEFYRTRGSEALKIRPEYNLPIEHERRRTPQRKKDKKTGLNYEKYASAVYIPSINLVGFVMLAVSVAFFIYTSNAYLKMNDSIINLNNEVKKINSETKKRMAENNNLENKIYSSIDLTEIREKAIDELGMVYPYKNHVIKYQAVSGGYVRQFGELEGGKKLSLFEKILSIFLLR